MAQFFLFFFFYVNCVFQLRTFIFDLFFGITSSLPGTGDEEGIRFKTGAVPAAVSLIKNFLNYAPLFANLRMGRQSKRRRARIPAEIHYIIYASGKIAKVNCNSLLFILSIQSLGILLRRISLTVCVIVVLPA